MSSQQHSTLELLPNGTFGYSPLTNFFGIDTFLYTADEDQFLDQLDVSLLVNGDLCTNHNDVHLDGQVDILDF